MADVEAILKNIGSIAIPAMRTFAMTFVLMLLLGLILLVPSFAIASKAGVGWGALAGFLALGVTAVIGFIMSQKRAIASGLMAAVEKYQAGSQAVQLIFSRIPSLDAAQSLASSLPLAEAERVFRAAIADLLSAPQEGGGAQGFIKRKLQESLFEKVTSITLSQFRAEEGGVDLRKVRDSISAKADALLTERLTAMKSSGLFVVGAIVASLAIAFVIRYATTRP